MTSGMVPFRIDFGFLYSIVLLFNFGVARSQLQSDTRCGVCAIEADFSKQLAFAWMKILSDEVKSSIQKPKLFFCNGYGFGNLPAWLILIALEYAVEVNASIFFYPRPKRKSLAMGTAEEQNFKIR
ncbi:hypothetical protein L1987_22205 [Smallanthus sonchifolius]|uniref:Uncharacterized protein n=1 Tax=Smallanthus sonchifolius TaxID=185202 RepID=A0ACB9IFQ0_9ASTR|nr:hypothetical protein L1987_22205 [Smallanthus sonchifolius]